MKNKKLLRLLIGLICLAVCTSVFLAACKDSGDGANEKPSETTQQQGDPTEPETTAPAVTDPEPTETEATEPGATEPEETQPEETEPEETEPEETQPSGGSSGPSVNTGTGGDYNPGSSEPTEPENATEPPISVPAPGSETNAYSEQVKEPTGSFNTVSIPAGQGMYYRLKTPGTFLRIEDADVSVVYNGTTYEPVEGVVEIILPADDSQAIALQLVNKSGEEKAFCVNIQDALGSETNPIILDSISSIQASLEAGDPDGVYYAWTADQSGVLNIALSGEEADAVITVAGESVQLSQQEGQAQIPVNAGDEVIIQVLTSEESGHPAAQAQITAYVAVIVDLTVSEIPAEVETVTVPGKQSVIYRISGIRGKTLKISDSSFRVLFDGTVYSADENGLITVKIPTGNSRVELELFNDAEEAKTTVFAIGYSLGHELNPQILTELGELTTEVSSDQNGYYYKYTAPSAGMVTFQVWTAPEQANAVSDIVLTNNTTGESCGLWGEDDAGEPVNNGTASVIVNQGDELTIVVSVKSASGSNLDASLVIYGELYGSEALPIQVMYPGFTAYVPAGETLYYEGYNLNGMIVTATGENMQISHNGVDYTSENGEISFAAVAAGRTPAVFAITNTGTENGAYEVVFTYPIGHSENPDQLLLGTNTLTQTAGATDYYYTFTAPKAGTLTLTFDSTAQWLYAVDNLTQGTYGDTQWSDSDPQVAETTITVKAKDVIQVRVNTYDAANVFEAPAGTVVFTVKYVSGPTHITSLTMPTNTNLASGEYGAYTGQFYDHVMTISNARMLVVHFAGNAYYADASGEIKVEFPASDGSGSQPDLEYIVQNTDTVSITRSMVFSTKDVGSMENPAPLQYGPNVMTQTQNNGADYYYTFTVTANGRFTITFDADSDWIYQLKNLTRNQDSGLQISSMGRYTYTMTVRKGDVLQLMVNTFDPQTGGSPIGTVEFSVSPA